MRSVPGRTRTNSSPPQRPARSTSRTVSWRSTANSRRTASPAGWPCRSLTSLNQSRSATTTARLPPKRSIRASSSSRVSSHWRRLAKPVRPSISACRSTIRCRRALCLELVETGLQLEGHLVERSAEQRELVTALDGHALFQVPACDRVSGVDQTPDGAHDRATFDVGHGRDEQERSSEADEQLVR